MARKILIADDEVHIRILMEKALEDLVEELDIELLTASDGDGALTLIRRETPQIVFLDIMMPHSDGFTVCQAVSQDPALRNTTIILLTAKGEESDHIRGAACGARYYLTKPFDPDHVLALARKLLTSE